MIVFISFLPPFPLENSLLGALLTEYLLPIRYLNDRTVLYSKTRTPDILIFSVCPIPEPAVITTPGHVAKSLILLPLVSSNKSHSIVSPVLKDLQKQFLKNK